MATTDSYRLQSGPVITLNGHEEEVVNIELVSVGTIETGVITGIVRLANGTAVSDAIVQLIQLDNSVVEHTTVNPSGRFQFTQVPVGSYFLAATAPAHLTTERIPVTVTRNTTSNVNITVSPDPNANKNAIYGSIVSTVNNQPVQDVTVELVKVTDTIETVVAIVTVNSEGQFLFGDLDNGQYYIRASRPGFIAQQSTSVTVTGRQFVPININISADPNANQGTVSGFITDKSTGNPIPNSLVALYAINNGTETVVNITRTNNSGYYLLGNVNPGSYRVRATVQVTN